jgi:hypothetical protein
MRCVEGMTGRSRLHNLALCQSGFDPVTIERKAAKTLSRAPEEAVSLVSKRDLGGRLGAFARHQEASSRPKGRVQFLGRAQYCMCPHA